MPNRNLTAIDNFASIILWLEDNLSQQFINAKCENINIIPNSKGIYFWYLNKEGYDAISKDFKISPFENIHAIIEDQIEYHLVYIGSSGTGKKGYYDLNQRLKWHLCEKHNEGSICTGFISTLRKGIGSLIANDLILPDTENEINEIFSRYFKIKWIEYSDSIHIDSDEKILINILKPLLNIKNNPNARANAIPNSTRDYKIRRNIITNATLIRLDCFGENENEMKKKLEPSEKAISYEHQKLSSENKCVEFTVSNTQSIAQVIRGIVNLPIGTCCVICYNSDNHNDIVYAKANGNGWRKTGSKGQNIYTYFSNIDTNQGNQYRWQIIQNEMILRGIAEITVKVCAEFNNDSYDKSNPKETKIQPILSSSNNINDKRIINESSAILITCAGSKQKPILNKSNLNNLSFPELTKYRNKMIELSQIQLDWDYTLPAWKLYSGPYSRLYPQVSSINWDKKCCDIKILSALFGWIKPWDMIPNYDLKMDSVITNEKGKFIVSDIWHHMNCLNKFYGANDIDLLSGNYRKALTGSTLPIGLVPEEFTDYGVQKGKWLNSYLNKKKCD
jgi:cytoplasmic iron level regulating protein YaaA (DUF328/UPF0246 family)